MGIENITTDQVARLAKRELFLPGSIHAAEIQLDTQIKLVDKMTAYQGIASEGYRQGLDCLSQNYSFFARQIVIDPSFLTKYGNFIDNVQQKFFKRLSAFGSITAAAPSLNGWMKKVITNALAQVDFGTVPNWQLPQTFLDYTSPPSPEDITTPVRTGKAKTKVPSPDPAWWSTNPKVFPAYCYPAGKKSSTYFNHTDKGKQNQRLFPKAPHHKTKKPATVCIKYQSNGSCPPECVRAHIPRSEMSSEVKNATDEAYSSAFKNPAN